MSSRSLGLLAGFFVSHGRSSPASWRLISSGSSVRKRMRPCNFTLSGRLVISRVRRGFCTLQFYQELPVRWGLAVRSVCFFGDVRDGRFDHLPVALVARILQIILQFGQHHLVRRGLDGLLTLFRRYCRLLFAGADLLRLLLFH